MLHAPWFDEIDFSHIEQIKTTFIRRDYRHLESDIVLTAPLAGSGRSRKNLLIYILIEHQSEPDRLMPLRLADSQLQIFRYQVRKWLQAHPSPARMRLSPVLPLVFYTGLRRWSQVGTLADLIERGDEFRPVTPIVERPLFFSLPELDAAKLERDGGFFGWVRRADGSGTSFIFTNYLSKLNGDWKSKVGEGTAVNLPVGVGCKGNEGVSGFVHRLPNSIGYVEFAYAKQNNMAYVSMRNRDGAYVKPDDAAFKAAAAGADWARTFFQILTDPPGRQSWPITGASFILMHKVPDKPANASPR